MLGISLSLPLTLLQIRIAKFNYLLWRFIDKKEGNYITAWKGLENISTIAWCILIMPYEVWVLTTHHHGWKQDCQSCNFLETFYRAVYVRYFISTGNFCCLSWTIILRESTSLCESLKTIFCGKTKCVYLLNQMICNVYLDLPLSRINHFISRICTN